MTIAYILLSIYLASQQTVAAFSSSRANRPYASSSSVKAAGSSALRMASDSEIRVMVNGMPGPMATAAAEACLRKGLILSPFAMTGPGLEPSSITVVDSVSGKHANVRLVPSSDMEEIESALKKTREKFGEDCVMAIDYTHPSAVNSNAVFYAKNNIPFVMGTTGGDREQLMKDMEALGASAVIAPNMGKQIVALQAGLEDLAKKFPSAFGGYTLHTKESQSEDQSRYKCTARQLWIV
jgi:Dihydrodipicolinate reductase